MDILEIYDLVRAKNKEKVFFSDSDLELAVEEVEQAILNYCCIPKVPNALRFTLVNMTIDLLTYGDAINKDVEEFSLDDIDISDVSTIKVGDTTVNVGESRRDNERKKVLNSHISNLDDIVYNYRQQLNRFRRLY